MRGGIFKRYVIISLLIMTSLSVYVWKNMVVNQAAEKHEASTPEPREVPHILYGADVAFTRTDFLKGYLFGAELVPDTRGHDIKISLVKDFSPFIEKEARDRTLDPFSEIKYCVMGPAFDERNADGFLIAFRLENCGWFHNPKTKHVLNQRSFVYMQQYNTKFEPIGNGRFLGLSYLIYPDRNFEISYHNGPGDPRAFTLHNKTFLTLQVIQPFTTDEKQIYNRPVVWDLEKASPLTPRLKNNVMIKTQLKEEYIQEKNWTPVVIEDELYFIQAFDPMLVIKCDDYMDCHYVNNKVKNDTQFDLVIRGGSPFKQYKGAYYIGAVHTSYKQNSQTSLSKQITKTGYGAHLAIVKMHPKVPEFRLLYVSDFLSINDQFFAQMNLNLRRSFIKHFFYPVSFMVETPDSVLIGGHVSDEKSALVRISGIEAMINDVIKRDDQINQMGIPPQKNSVQSFFKSHIEEIYPRGVEVDESKAAQLSANKPKQFKKNWKNSTRLNNSP